VPPSSISDSSIWCDRLVTWEYSHVQLQGAFELAASLGKIIQSNVMLRVQEFLSARISNNSIKHKQVDPGPF